MKLSIKKPLPIGIDKFDKLIDGGYYYVDKTLFIKELLDMKGEVNLFTRPRRFGKTLALSMVQCFFETGYDYLGRPINNERLFDGLAIMEQGEKYTKHFGKYPVISLSLKSAKQPEFEMAYLSIVEEISNEFERHKEVLENKGILESDKEKYKAIMERRADKISYAKSIAFLSKVLAIHYQKNVIILIDEYDVPLENAYFKGFYEEMTDFIRSLFESALKTNPFLEFSVITGCLRISKESIFTGLNNLEIISILNETYSENFGFTQLEVDKILEFYDIKNKKKEMKKWYDGYLFGNTEVYNPWSVINYVKSLCANSKSYPKPYWSNTSSNSIIRSLIEKADMKTKSEIQELIDGNAIEKAVFEEVTYEDINKKDDNLWSFLLFTGYLKKVSKRQEGENIYVKMAIPNSEVRYIYKNMIIEWFNNKIKQKDFSKMYEAMFNGDELTFEEELVSVLEETISFNDSYENFYHGFLVGVLSNIDNYEIKSNRESGIGRSDIIIKYPNRRGKAVIIEIKVAKNVNDLENKCYEALNQIEEKKYDMELVQDGYKDILKYGIVFYKKDCMIKCKNHL
ncbi:MAG: AAA family ATPase [Clostridium sp.]|nr:AAA family ATPase [Clostridium sp.]